VPAAMLRPRMPSLVRALSGTATRHAPTESATVQHQRVELAMAHRLTALYGWTDLVWNHISVRHKEDPSSFLITPGRKMFSLMEPEDLAISNSASNDTGIVIHSAIFDARLYVNAIVHTHLPAIVQVSCLESGVQLLTQDAAAFHNRVRYHPWEGLSTDEDEKERLAESLGPDPYDVLIMEHHGACTTGKTLAEAWVKMYYLNVICTAQMELLKSGARLKPVPEEVLIKASEQIHSWYPHGQEEWGALMAMVEKEMPIKAV